MHDIDSHESSLLSRPGPRRRGVVARRAAAGRLLRAVNPTARGERSTRRSGRRRQTEARVSGDRRCASRVGRRVAPAVTARANRRPRSSCWLGRRGPGWEISKAPTRPGRHPMALYIKPTSPRWSLEQPRQRAGALSSNFAALERLPHQRRRRRRRGPGISKSMNAQLGRSRRGAAQRERRHLDGANGRRRGRQIHGILTRRELAQGANGTLNAGRLGQPDRVPGQPRGDRPHRAGDHLQRGATCSRARRPP